MNTPENHRIANRGGCREWGNKKKDQLTIKKLGANAIRKRKQKMEEESASNLKPKLVAGWKKG